MTKHSVHYVVVLLSDFSHEIEDSALVTNLSPLTILCPLWQIDHVDLAILFLAWCVVCDIWISGLKIGELQDPEEHA